MSVWFIKCPLALKVGLGTRLTKTRNLDILSEDVCSVLGQVAPWPFAVTSFRGMFFSYGEGQNKKCSLLSSPAVIFCFCRQAFLERAIRAVRLLVA